MAELHKPEESVKYRWLALDIFIKSYGENHPDVAKTFNNLGNTYNDLGLHDKALFCFQKVQVICVKALGKTHTDTVVSYKNLGRTYNLMMDYEKALDQLFEGLALCKVMGAIDKSLIITSFHNTIGASYQGLGNFDKTLEHKNKALSIMIDSFGERDSRVLDCQDNLAQVYDAFGAPKQAIEVYNTILETHLTSKEQNAYKISLIYNRLGTALQNAKRNKEALESFQQSLLHMKNGFENQPEVVGCYNNIASCYYKLGDYSNALKYYEQALDIGKKILGSVHGTLTFIYDGIGETCKSLGNLSEALKYNELAVLHGFFTHGKDSSELINFYHNLTITLKRLGKNKEEVKAHIHQAFTNWKEQGVLQKLVSEYHKL